jgi:hypothetical protein
MTSEELGDGRFTESRRPDALLRGKLPVVSAFRVSFQNEAPRTPALRDVVSNV